MLYLTTDTSAYAIDAGTCRLIWRTAVPYPELGFLKNNHGAAYMGGRLFRVNGGVNAYALDAATGRVLWSVSFRQRAGEAAPMAPVAWNGFVFVGRRDYVLVAECPAPSDRRARDMRHAS